MRDNKTSTSDVNSKSIALLTPHLLTLQANEDMDKKINKDFGKWLKPLIESLPKSQADVAREAGVSVVQLSRIVTGVSGVKRDTAISIIDTINKIAGKDIADKSEGLNIAGFSLPEHRKSEAAGIFRALKEIPEERKELAMKQIKAIIKTHIEDENFDFDYIDD